MYLESEHSLPQRTGRILVVDDDPDIRSLTRTFLEHEGHTVYLSGDPDRATHIFRRSPGIDLLIADYSLPQRSGLDLARELTMLSPSLRVLIISGAILPSLHSDRIALQGWKILTKPFSLPALLAEVHKILAPDPYAGSSATLIA
ncbi:MAG TPA: response regulator [Edaphobacter sp.]